MKRKLLLKLIHKRGAVFVRHGRKHDIYVNPKTGIVEQVPRHADIEENLAKNIIKRLS
ncbi:MAG: addiction module toxin, HicA family [Treponema sp.]|jgi:predicted RNA binding protein YcfA (HicA-like mRNA interferase family)|nr:addiction module toxin, HicA family [Treponema sp.]